MHWHIGDWNKKIIGISKCKNMHVGAILALIYAKVY